VAQNRLPAYNLKNEKTSMKKIVLGLSVAFVAMFFASCNNQNNPELDAAIKANDSLQQIISTKDAELDSMFATLNEIEENLAAVNSRYNTIQELRRANLEGQPNVKNQINEQIKNIESLMASNKQKLANLQAKIKTEGNESTRLQELVSRQEERIAAQESQIAELLTELESNKVLIK
jgi:chromosome segregation ATPase